MVVKLYRAEVAVAHVQVVVLVSDLQRRVEDHRDEVLGHFAVVALLRILHVLQLRVREAVHPLVLAAHLLHCALLSVDDLGANTHY